MASWSNSHLFWLHNSAGVSWLLGLWCYDGDTAGKGGDLRSLPCTFNSTCTNTRRVAYRSTRKVMQRGPIAAPIKHQPYYHLNDRWSALLCTSPWNHVKHTPDIHKYAHIFACAWSWDTLLPPILRKNSSFIKGVVQIWTKASHLLLIGESSIYVR
jgi:hypothetical protein